MRAKNRLSHRRTGRAVVGAAVAGLGSLWAVSCSDSDEETGPVDVDVSGYAVQLLLDGPDGRISYVARLDDVDVEEVRADDAFEVVGNARVYTQPGKLWVGSGESPTITRYGTTAAGALAPAEELTVSLAGLGFAQSPFGHVFISDTQAYLFGPTVARWNPETMELEGDIGLEPAI
ncbi:MAG: hypothetical protein AAGA56_26520, partial [Myxococcota bacterium]